MVDNILAVTPKVIEKIQKLSKENTVNKKNI
jgi:hypothetical protein